ncbi:MAG: serine/threonine-protein kinase [Polyangiaceae bacterium]
MTPTQEDRPLAERYRLGELLGEGGMGAVHAATHVVTGKALAVKLLPSDRSLDEAAIARFRREARAAGVLDTEHIVQIFDSGLDGQQAYIAMERLEGEDLKALETRLGRLPPALAARIVAQACRGVAAAHEKGIVHRDLKPSNLFLTASGDDITVKVLDFGIAKLDPGLREVSDGEDLTRTGTVLGSPHYISPEQIRAQQRVDRHSDVFSLGVVLYEALVGRRPHEDAATLMEVLFRTYMEPAPPLARLAPWVDPTLAAIVHRALELRPEARYADAGALGHALESWLDASLDITADMLVPLADDLAALAPAPAPRADDDATETGTETDDEMRQQWAATREEPPDLPVAVPEPPPHAVPTVAVAPAGSSPARRWLALGAAAAIVIAVIAWPRPATELDTRLLVPAVVVASAPSAPPPPASSEAPPPAPSTAPPSPTPAAASTPSPTLPSAAPPTPPPPHTISKDTGEFD